MAKASRKANKTEAKTKTQTEETCPIAQSVLWATQATEAATANPDAHPQAMYKRTEKQFAVMAAALVKEGANGTVPLARLVTMGFNPKVRHQSFWGTGKHHHGARAVAQQLHGLGFTATVEKGVVVENGKRSATYGITLGQIKPCGRYAPTK